MKSRELAVLAARAIAEKKGREISILKLEELSLLTDYFVLASGNSRVQTQAIADHVEEEMNKAGLPLARREGYPEGRWILMDFGVVIVHIFQDEERNFYSLERLWADAPQVPFEE
ncbi:MAG: ribosome silencing factor [Peptococcaceae bacterium]|jgi:ribosome-associated protein|nr:ribosome silencing factor [Peptococcaceae bacterium]MDH7524425.1 ribosome silencing factor [Peptococcaceae bacterium]